MLHHSETNQKFNIAVDPLCVFKVIWHQPIQVEAVLGFYGRQLFFEEPSAIALFCASQMFCAAIY